MILQDLKNAFLFKSNYDEVSKVNCSASADQGSSLFCSPYFFCCLFWLVHTVYRPHGLIFAAVFIKKKMQPQVVDFGKVVDANKCNFKF